MTRLIPTARRICPACLRRDEGLLDPDCLVCAGTGVLELGRAALSRFTPETVSRAIEKAIECQARHSLAVPNPDLDRCRRDVVSVVARLRDGKILAPRQPLPRPGPKPPAGQQWATTDERPYGYGDHDFSAATYLTQLVPAPISPPRPEGLQVFTVLLDDPHEPAVEGAEGATCTQVAPSAPSLAPSVPDGPAAPPAAAPRARGSKAGQRRRRARHRCR